MSLLRMRRTTDKELRTLDEVLLEFQTDLDNYIDANTEYNFKSLINSYWLTRLPRLCYSHY